MTKKDIQTVAIMAGWFVLMLVMCCIDSIVDALANFIFNY